MGFDSSNCWGAADLLVDVPVVVLLEPGDRHLAATYLLMGVDDCLICPPDTTIFPARVRGCIDKQRLRGRRIQELRKQLGEARAWNDKLLDQVIPIGASMVQETDYNRLLERIVLEAMASCDADAERSTCARRKTPCALRSCAPARWASSWAAQRASRSRFRRCRCAIRTPERRTIAASPRTLRSRPDRSMFRMSIWPKITTTTGQAL